MSPTKVSMHALYLTSMSFFLSAIHLHLSNKLILLDWLFSNISVNPLVLTLIIDKQGLLLSSVVLFISANVINFASTYMLGDPFIKRFTTLVLLFILSMNFLIFIPNLVTVMLGWDGLGLISFLLVVYYSNPKSLSAGMITALTNRIGDALILLSIAWLMNENHWTINLLWPSPSSQAIMLSITLAACTKSAQVPFSSWLPAAMAAPTPVSALVHSSTLVTAGVFLLIRFYPFLSKIPNFNLVLTTMACLTMLMAGMAATVEPDLKKIIALSTLSQLGVMMGSLGIGAPDIALFHLMTHALFKALLFVCAGTIIHFNSHNQDLRTAGSMLNLPVTSSCFIIANLALCGAPFLAAFYSKDIILEDVLFSPLNFVLISMFFTATAFTAIYTSRFMISLLWAPSNFQPLNSFSEDKMMSSLPLLMLTTAAICGGSIMNWLLVTPLASATLPLFMKMSTLMVTIMGAWAAALLTTTASSQQINLQKPTHFNLFMWFLVPLSSQTLLAPPMKMAKHLLSTIDQGWQEILGGQGTLKTSTTLFKAMAPTSNNLISIQLLLSTLIILLILMWNLTT
uniref:NADH dehydrogenase subunit 5 n=1 Tax=Pseudopotamilla reniformis TaxID=279639 RepID=UPI001FAF5468|nr:NADH dehydrogenase subunit 5 [Pseudopotamilla reniformis]ULD67137.1 NADH dehydrogenase subunit 5 [Pseudopotamilla reniformis]